MIREETESSPENYEFDVAIVAVGYERRCRFVTKLHDIKAKISLGLEFGFLTDNSYPDNRRFFLERGFELISGTSPEASTRIELAIGTVTSAKGPTTVFVDISSMSREMIAHVLVGLQAAASKTDLKVSAAYAPSKFTGPYNAAPIRRAGPIAPMLAGWSSRPEVPLGVVFGLGCEPNLALGALQLLEPKKAWVFEPKGTDSHFDDAMRSANQDIGEIFDVTSFGYDIVKPTSLRGRFEALINSIESDFRLIIIPFGPKVFAWSTIFTVLLESRQAIGVWAFSSNDQAIPVDRDAEGVVIWHRSLVDRISASSETKVML